MSPVIFEKNDYASPYPVLYISEEIKTKFFYEWHLLIADFSGIWLRVL